MLRGDHFGNLILDASRELLAAARHLARAPRCGCRPPAPATPARYAATFADVPAGELLLYEDAQRMVALAVNRGSAAERLGARLDEELAGARGVSERGCSAAGHRAQSPGRSAGRGCTCARPTRPTTRARALAIAGAPHGTLVTRRPADRRARAPGPALVGARPAARCCCRCSLRSPPPLLPLIAAVAVCDVAGAAARIKWPNDIVVDATSCRAGAAAAWQARGDPHRGPPAGGLGGRSGSA